MNFSEFLLDERLQKGIDSAGYIQCTPVQEQVLKAVQNGRDLYVQSQTGTGKTCAYLSSVLQQLLAGGSNKKALILVPTRELAVQVEEEAKKLSAFSELKCASFYGGVGYDKQIKTLNNGVDIIIGTPGRVIDLQVGGQLKMDEVRFLVIDEADRMFDMGFYPDLRTLIKVLPPVEKRCTMLFSATLNSYVKNLAWEYTSNPEEITIEAENITVDEIDQLMYHVSSDKKINLLLGIISQKNPESLIIFSNTKKSCEILSKRLKINGIENEFLIGDLPQKVRLSIMNKFKSGKIKCLVATDVAARGIDVNDLQMVINYDLPVEAENYVHRIGRTARAGKTGIAYTFCSEQDVYSLPSIERYIEKQIPSEVADESLMAEDKSKDIYIRLDSHHSERNDKSEYGKKKQQEFNSRHSSGPKGNGRYSSRNRSSGNEYKRDRRVWTKEEEDKLAMMSSEERMKLYREKYAGKNNSNAAVKNSSSQVSANKKSSKKNSVKTDRIQNKSVKKENKQKKSGILGKIKKLFGKK